MNKLIGKFLIVGFLMSSVAGFAADSKCEKGATGDKKVLAGDQVTATGKEADKTAIKGK